MKSDKKKLEEKLNQYEEYVESKYNDYISSVYYANFDSLEHIMLVEDEKTYIDVFEIIENDFFLFENIDLIDFLNMGEYD